MLNNNFKIFLKEIIGKTISVSNLSNRITKNKFYIFCYHEVTDKPSPFQKRNKLFVSKKVFIKQIGFIKKLFKIIHPHELQSSLNLQNKALITFDDGYKNSFHYCLNLLKKTKITPIFFLNMSAIKYKIPILPASLEYLEMNYDKYENYIKKFNLSKPVSLKIKPLQFKVFKKFIKQKRKNINSYQGEMISFNYLLNNQTKKTFFISDHLYEHYNCLALTEKEISYFCKKNLNILKKFKNHLNTFSFPNGVPNKCFNNKNINWIKKLNYQRAFSCGNKSNLKNDKFVLDRISLNNEDNTYNKFLFKLAKSIN